MKDDGRQLKDIYRAFEEKSLSYTGTKACQSGCSYCCKKAGTIDITTLEGMQIRAAMARMPKPRQQTLTKIFRKEIRLREAGKVTACPFLMKNNRCMIYESRPFSCRRIYSGEICSDSTPPVVSRQYMEMSKETLKEIQTLDINGYSGHLSYILYLLSRPEFMTTYSSGAFHPEAVADFGRSHRIVINKSVV